MKSTVLIILTLCLSVGCVTQKSRHDQSKLGLLYQNMTAKYNGWFNANELLEESIATLEAQHEDNYNELLPIYEYNAVENTDAVKGNLDEAIKKVSVVVTLHEYSDWADDCYLLIGKALYLKQDYEASENAFEFYMDEFLPNGKHKTIKDKKKHKSAASANRESSASAREANKRQRNYKKHGRKQSVNEKLTIRNYASAKRKDKAQMTWYAPVP